MNELNPSSIKLIEEAVEREIYIPTNTYIVILCLILLTISIILEITKLKSLKRKGEKKKKEVIDFSIVLILALIGVILYITSNELIAIKGIVCLHSSITDIMLYFSLIISIIMVIKPLIYIIKQKRNKNL